MLLGRQRQAVTVYEHDPEGRLVRSVTTFDAEWSDEDLGALFEWQDEQSGLCPGCGLPLDETTHPDAEDRFDAVGVRCHACKVKGIRSEEFAKRGRAAGMLWFPKQL